MQTNCLWLVYVQANYFAKAPAPTLGFWDMFVPMFVFMSVCAGTC